MSSPKAIHGSVSAGQVAVVDLAPGGWAGANGIIVTNVSQGEPLYVRLDGIDPEVRGLDSRLIMDWRKYLIAEEGNPISQIRITCVNDADYSVETTQ